MADDEFDEFDDVLLPDLTQLDFTQYDAPPPPSTQAAPHTNNTKPKQNGRSNTSYNTSSRVNTTNFRASTSRRALPLVRDEDEFEDDGFWGGEGGVRVNENGEYEVLAPGRDQRETMRDVKVEPSERMDVDQGPSRPHQQHHQQPRRPPQQQNHPVKPLHPQPPLHRVQQPSRPPIARNANGSSSSSSSRQTSFEQPIQPASKQLELQRLAMEAELRESRQKQEELFRQLEEQREAALSAKGESSMLRRSLAEEKRKADLELERVKAQHAAEADKRRKREEEKRQEDESNRIKNTLDNHNAATFSARRLAYPPTSVSRNPNNRGQNSQFSQSQWGGAGGGQSQYQQTPAPLARKSSKLGGTGESAVGGGGGRSLDRYGAGGGASGTTSRKGKERENLKAPMPPVPRFPQFHNAFASVQPPFKARDTSRVTSSSRKSEAPKPSRHDSPQQQFDPYLDDDNHAQQDFPSFTDHASNEPAPLHDPIKSTAPALAPPALTSRRSGISRSTSVQNPPFARTTSAQNVFSRTTSGNQLLSPAGQRGFSRSPTKQQQLQQKAERERSGSITPGRREEKKARKVEIDRLRTGTSPIKEEMRMEERLNGALDEMDEDEDEFGDSVDGEDEGDLLEDGEPDEEDIWEPDAKDLLLSIAFSHHSHPLLSSLPHPIQLSRPPTHPSSPAPSQSQPNGTASFNPSSLSVPSIQIILAPLSHSAPAKDRSEHSKACTKILAGLGGSRGVGGGGGRAEGGGEGSGDPLGEVVRGLVSVAKVFSRQAMLCPLTQSLKLLHALTLHLPRSSLILLHLPSLLPLLSHIKDHHLPPPTPPLDANNAKSKSRGSVVASREGTTSAAAIAAASVEAADAMLKDEDVAKRRKSEEEKRGREEVLKGVLNLLEVFAWEAEEGDVDALSAIVLLPNLLSTALAPTQQVSAVLQMVRILVLLSIHEALYTPLLSFPDLYPATAARDATRIPLVDRLCRYLREPHPLATPQQTLNLNLDIVTFFRTLCDIHQEEAVIVLGSSWSLIPTLVICLERLSAIVWGVRPTIENVSLSIPPLLPILSLLSLLTSPFPPHPQQQPNPDDPDAADYYAHPSPQPQPLIDLAEILRKASARKTEFVSAFERFMVGFGRICYADAPGLAELFVEEEGLDLVSLASGGEIESGGKGRQEGERWEAELERAGEIARDIFDLVIEGPEGDLVYAVFGSDDDEEDEDDDEEVVEIAAAAAKDKGNKGGAPVASGDGGMGSLTQQMENVGKAADERDEERRVEKRAKVEASSGRGDGGMGGREGQEGREMEGQVDGDGRGGRGESRKLAPNRTRKLMERQVEETTTGSLVVELEDSDDDDGLG